MKFEKIDLFSACEYLKLKSNADISSLGIQAAIFYISNKTTQQEAADKYGISRQRVNHSTRLLFESFREYLELMDLFKQTDFNSDCDAQFKIAMMLTNGKKETASIAACRDVLIFKFSIEDAAKNNKISIKTVYGAVDSMRAKFIKALEFYKKMKEIDSSGNK